MESLSRFRPQYEAAWSAGMREKLGLSDGLDEAVTSTLVTDLLALLREQRVDYTSFFRSLGDEPRRPDQPAQDGWLTRWRALGPDLAAMNRVNPAYIPRNHLVEEALSAATGGDLGPFTELLQVVGAPYDERPGLERYAAPTPAGSSSYRTFCGT